MVKRKKTAVAAKILCFIVMVALSCVSFGCYGGESGAVVRKDGKNSTAAEKERHPAKNIIYLITMDQGSNYWQQIDIGCQSAVAELSDVSYKWIAPANHTEAEQIECVNRAIKSKADVILISAISPTGLNDALKRADEAGIKIIYVDSAAEYPALATFITDSEKAGQMAGQTMLKALAEAGITSGNIGIGASKVSKNGILRDKGFRDAIAKSKFTVAPTVSMEGNRENIWNFVKDTPNFVGYFGANEQITRSLCEQVKESGTKQIIVGFDTSDFTLSMINEGLIYATMQQNPQKMGHDGIMLAARALRGEYKDPPGKVIDMGVTVITRDKINE